MNESKPPFPRTEFPLPPDATGPLPPRFPDPYSLEALSEWHAARMRPLRFIANLWTGVIVFGLVVVMGSMLWAAWKLL